MESLLRWGIENSNPDNLARQQPQDLKPLDPAIIDAILGKSDADLMKEALAVAVDESKAEDDRVQALDDFEMLVEQIDNANNMVKLKMWEPIHDLLSSPSDPIQRQVLWVIGTAVHNNPSAQASYLALSPLPTLLSFLLPSVPSPKTRSKAVYTLSGLLKHNAPAVRQMEETGGWDNLKQALEDSDINVRRKVAFLLNTLLLPSAPEEESSSSNATRHPNAPALHGSDTQPAASNAPIHPNSHASMLSDPSSVSTTELTQHALEQRGLLQTLVQSLVSPVPFGPDGEIEHDPDYEELIIHVLHTYLVTCRGQLPPNDRTDLAKFLNQQTGSSSQLAEKWNLDTEQVESLKRAVS